MMQHRIISEDTILEPVPIKPGLKSNFGEKRSYEIHPGVDIPVPVGTKVVSPMNGVVKIANMNYNPLCGGTIEIDYQNGFTSRFCHMSRVDVKEGDNVTQGQVVGLSGGEPGTPGAGNTTGPHLHFTLKKDGTNVDPLQYVNTPAPQSQAGSEVQDVQSVAARLGSSPSEMSWEEFEKKYPPEMFRKALEKSLTGVFAEEVKRIKQLMK